MGEWARTAAEKLRALVSRLSSQWVTDPNCSVRRLIRSRVLRGVALVAGGTATAQAITVGISPLITRLYSPEAFGVLGVFVSVVSVLSPLATLSYNHAVALPRSEEDGRALVALASCITFAVAALVALLFFIVREPIATWLGFEDHSGYLPLVAVIVLFSGIEQTFVQWLVRRRQLKGMSVAAIGKAAGTGAGQVGLGLVSPSAGALMYVVTGGYVLHALLLWLFGGRTLFAASERRVTITDVLRVARDYRDFPQFRAPQVGLNALARNLPVVLLSAFFGPAVAGFYSLGRRVLGLPAKLISQSVGKVILPYLVETAHASGDLRRIIVRATAGLFFVGIIPFGTVIVFGPSLFSAVFGDDWVVAGEYARWLSVWLLPMFINRPSVQAIPILGLQRPLLLFEGLSVSSRTAAILIGAFLFETARAAIVLYSVVGLVLNVMLIGSVIYFARYIRRETVEREASRL